MPLPEWMKIPASEPPPMGRYRRSWVTKAIGRLIVLTAPAGARKPSPVAIDPRAALVLFVGLIVCTTFLRSPMALAVSCATAVVLALAAGAPARLLALAMFGAAVLTGAAMVPAAMAAATVDTLRLAAVVALRSAACLAYGIGLFSSNTAEELFAALRWFRLPSIFVAVLLLTYRYLQVVARAALDDHLARKSRVADDYDLAAARKWAGERIGALFTKSKELGEEVHLGMISRGFDGAWMPRPVSSVRSADIGWVAVCAAVSVLLLALDRGML